MTIRATIDGMRAANAGAQFTVWHGTDMYRFTDSEPWQVREIDSKEVKRMNAQYSEGGAFMVDIFA